MTNAPVCFLYKVNQPPNMLFSIVNW